MGADLKCFCFRLVTFGNRVKGARVGQIEIVQLVASVLGSAVVQARSMPVRGLIGLEIRLADGRHLAVKARAGDRGPAADLTLEAYMLGELARLTDLPVPKVHHAEANLLVMDFIETDGSGITSSAERHAGELIANLHAVARASFGYERDTSIGPLAQPNRQSQAWVPFFRDQRLLHMAGEAHREGSLPASLLHRIWRLAERISDYILEPPFPSLLHGDLWRGNVLVCGGRIAGLVDPAIYCGHPEIELAFATLFGTFGEAFFDAYECVMPLEPGFYETRLDIYNLYPRLVHVRLFGASYLAGIEKTLARLGF
jgi:fructosamine-3-kinase